MLESGQVIQQRYQLQHSLGQNAGRQTWLAEDISTDAKELVVVKFLAFGGTIQWEDLKLFEREAQVLRQLEHSRIPKYRDFFSIDDRTLWFALVQDYIFGTSLKASLQDGRKFTESQLRAIAIEVLRILTYLHCLNPPLLHRDIKPSNLILGEDDQIYLVDFGAVQDKAVAEGATFTVVGTYGYAPMEQFGGRAVPASDLYALGATLIHLATGIPPGDLPQRNMRLQFRDRVSLSIEMVQWIERLTEPAVEKRYGSAQEALADLESGKLGAIAPEEPLMVAAPPNNSGQGKGNLFDNSIPIPEEIQGWNWGACLLPTFWPLTNQVWIGLIAWIPLVGSLMGLVLGRKGNEWAWKSRKWRSIQQFKSHQRGWTIAALFLGVPGWLPNIYLLSTWLGSAGGATFYLALACLMGTAGLLIAGFYWWQWRRIQKK